MDPLVADAPRSPELMDRFARIEPLGAVALIVALAALALFGLCGTINGPCPTPKVVADGSRDLQLYRTIMNDVRAGEPYDVAAVREQRAEGYPLRPFVTVRLPTVAVAMAALPSEAARRLSLSALALVTLGAWGWRLHGAIARPLHLAVAVALMSTGVMFVLVPTAYLLHECWAGLLIALSLAVWRPGRWAASLAFGLAAICVRELAAPYFLAMAVLAWRDRARAEAAAWAAGLAGFAGLMLLHAMAMQPLLRPGDPTSASWVAFGGWPQLLALLRWNAVLSAMPTWVAALIAPFMILGFAGRSGRLGDRLALVTLGYLAAFMVVGRSNNIYWGLMIAPLCPIGMAFAWPAFSGLVQRTFRAIRPTASLREI